MKAFLTSLTMPKVIVVTAILAMIVGWFASDRRTVPQTKMAQQKAIIPDTFAPMPDPQSLRADHFQTEAGSSKSVVVKPVKVWQGKLLPDTPIAGCMPGQVILNGKAWQRLWKKFRGTELLPRVDFKKELVVLCTIRGWILADLSVRKSRTGGVSVSLRGRGINDSGCSYIFAKFSRNELGPAQKLLQSRKNPS